MVEEAAVVHEDNDWGISLVDETPADDVSDSGALLKSQWDAQPAPSAPPPASDDLSSDTVSGDGDVEELMNRLKALNQS